MSEKKPNLDLDHWISVQCKMNRLFVHDLKNPISALAANLNYLETVPLEDSEDLREALRDSVLAADMLLKLVENFDTIALLESGEHFPIHEINVADFIRSAAGRNRASADSAGIRISLREPLPSISQSWQTRYAELLIDNLIMSAVRHSPHGGSVFVELYEQNGNVCIAVSDQGQPVAKDFREDLFSRESQVEAKKKPSCRYGRGLGLYAAGLAATTLGGYIQIGEKDGLSEFVFICPIVKRTDDL